MDELEYYKEMELRYNQLIEEKNKDVERYNAVVAEMTKYKDCLNKIAMHGMSELAYTYDFTEVVMELCRDALGFKSRWPY